MKPAGDVNVFAFMAKALEFDSLLPLQSQILVDAVIQIIQPFLHILISKQQDLKIRGFRILVHSVFLQAACFPIGLYQPFFRFCLLSISEILICTASIRALEIQLYISFILQKGETSLSIGLLHLFCKRHLK